MLHEPSCTSILAWEEALTVRLPQRLRRSPSALHAHGVRSHAVPIEPVGLCSIPL